MATSKVSLNGVTLIDISDTTATAEDVLNSKYFYTASGQKQQGTATGGTVTLQTKSKSYTPTESAQSETVTYDTGYDGLQSVSISVGAISATYVGTGVTRKSATTYNTSTTDQTISASQYMTGVQTIKAVTVSGLSANTILSGTTVKIGDANDDDRIASVSGSVTFQTIYSGSSTPSSSTGVNGDIYVRTVS